MVFTIYFASCIKTIKSIVRESNEKLLNSAFDLERERQYQATENALKVQIAQLETTLKSDLNDKAHLTEGMHYASMLLWQTLCEKNEKLLLTLNLIEKIYLIIFHNFRYLLIFMLLNINRCMMYKYNKIFKRLKYKKFNYKCGNTNLMQCM